MSGNISSPGGERNKENIVDDIVENDYDDHFLYIHKDKHYLSEIVSEGGKNKIVQTKKIQFKKAPENISVYFHKEKGPEVLVDSFFYHDGVIKTDYIEPGYYRFEYSVPGFKCDFSYDLLCKYDGSLDKFILKMNYENLDHEFAVRGIYFLDHYDKACDSVKLLIKDEPEYSFQPGMKGSIKVQEYNVTNLPSKKDSNIISPDYVLEINESKLPCMSKIHLKQCLRFRILSASGKGSDKSLPSGIINLAKSQYKLGYKLHKQELFFPGSAEGEEIELLYGDSSKHYIIATTFGPSSKHSDKFADKNNFAAKLITSIRTPPKELQIFFISQKDNVKFDGDNKSNYKIQGQVHKFVVPIKTDGNNKFSLDFVY